MSLPEQPHHPKAPRCPKCGNVLDIGFNQGVPIRWSCFTCRKEIPIERVR